MLGLLFVTGHAGRDSIAFVVACLVVFMLFNAGGLQLMGWLTGSETYPLAVRPAGTAVQSAALWGTNLLITLTLLSLISAIGVGPAMWLYAAFNVAAWLFVYFRMPDLTGASLEEIEGKLADGQFRPADFTPYRGLSVTALRSRRPGATTIHRVTASPIAIETAAIDGGVIIAVAGEIDLLTADELTEALATEVARQALVVVDLTAVSFLSSSGLAALALAHRAAVEADHVLRIVAGNRVTLRPIQITGLADEIGVFASLPDAVAGVAAFDSPIEHG